MKFLLDTHTLIWVLTDSPRLSKVVREIMLNQKAKHFVSAASVMEIFTKHRLGKLPEADGLIENWAEIMAAPGYSLLPITNAHAKLAGQMDIDHKDPFDRLLIAQSIIENFALLSNEKIFDSFGIERIW